MGGHKRLAVLVLVTIGVCLFVGAYAGHPARAQTEAVIVGVPHDLYPEYAIRADDRPGGFGVDVMNAVAKRAGLSVTYRVFPSWSDTLAALEHGEIDLIPIVTITPAREQTLLLTRPVLTSSISVFVRQDEETMRSVDELAGRRMGVIKGGSAPEWLGKGGRPRFSCRTRAFRTKWLPCCWARSTRSSRLKIPFGSWPKALASPTGSRSSASP